MAGVPWHLQILADQLILSRPGEACYAHIITNAPPPFSEFPTALSSSIDPFPRVFFCELSLPTYLVLTYQKEISGNNSKFGLCTHNV